MAKEEPITFEPPTPLERLARDAAIIKIALYVLIGITIGRMLAGH